MKKSHGTFERIRKIRNDWIMNPRTRVQENEIKSKKKRRQNEKKLVKDGWNE